MTDDARSTSAAPSAPPAEGDDPASARAKPLPLRLPLVPQDSPAQALIPARMINEVLCIIIQTKGENAREARLSNTSHVSLYGSVHMTMPAFQTLMERGIPVLFFSYGGWFARLR